MSEPLDKPTALRLLGELDRRDRHRRLFGAGVHQYRLNPPLDASVVGAFEARHGVSLPDDYRTFLTEIGDGGAGPSYGLFPFGQQDDGFGSCAWEIGGLVGDFSQPFPHVTAWNISESFWQGEPDPPPGTPPEEEDRLWEAWDKVLEERYWDPALMNGAIPICHLGCALRQWLVIHGPQRGFVWNDFRADYRGLSPVLGGSGEAVTFAAWYRTWLDDSMRAEVAPLVSAIVPLWRRIWRRFGRINSGQEDPGSPPS